ncbi:MAG TPA: hypothetical protein VLK61_06865 [Aquabacterium sp.]|nr:hypothetical protein [Aquabacterium sp.]
MPALLRWASRIEAWPPTLWLGLQVLALWPSAGWALGRFSDAAGEVSGLLALALLLLATTRIRPALIACDWAARTPWLLAAALLTALVTAWTGRLPPAAVAGLSALALACAWTAFRPSGALVWPWPGLPQLSWPAQRMRVSPRPSLRPIELAMRRLQRAAAWKCAYAAVLAGCCVATGW